MPELAEVEFYRKKWNPGLQLKIKEVLFSEEVGVFRNCNIKKLSKLLRCEKLISSETHGKQMLFKCSGNIWLGVHLGMSGFLKVEDLKYKLEKHDHFALKTDELHLIYNDHRQFGQIRIEKNKEYPSWFQNLPPSILSDDFLYENVSKFLERRKKSPIKAVILDQRQFPGIGNWLADEILFRAQIKPSRLTSSLKKREKITLFDTIIKTCLDAMEVMGSDGGGVRKHMLNKAPEDWLFNYRWKGGFNCPKTGKLLLREQIAGRTTCWSPHWQK